MWIFGPRNQGVPKIFGFGRWEVWGTKIRFDQAGTIIGATIIMALGWLRYSRRGLEVRAMTPTGGAITKVDSFIPADWFLQRPGLLLGFGGAFLLLLGALLVWRLVNSERLGLVLRAAKTSREDEAFSEAVGIDFRRARLLVFVISSAARGDGGQIRHHASERRRRTVSDHGGVRRAGNAATDCG